MKLIEAIVDPMHLQAICHTLRTIGAVGLTVTDVKIIGRREGMAGSVAAADSLPRAKLEIAVLDGQLNRVIEAIRRVTGTDHGEDAEIFVVELPHALRIRTKELDVSAV